MKLSATVLLLLLASAGGLILPAQANTNAVHAVEQKAFVADYHAPATTAGHYGVIVLGGAEGGKPELLARFIASAGHPVLALAYFKAPTLPAELEMIPVEYFDKPRVWLMQQPGVKTDGVILVGWSKGAELALQLAARNPQVRGVVAISPSSVRWAGILKDWKKIPQSSWSADGNPLPHVPFDASGGADSLVALYTHSLNNTVAVQKAAIEVERIAGSVLLLSGSKDAIWPAQKMADAVCERMLASKSDARCEHINYADHGHLLDEKFLDSSAQTQHPSRERIFKFLQRVNASKDN